MYKQITRKQAGVIYRATKEGKIEMSQEQISAMYDLTAYNGYDDNGTKQAMNDRFQLAVEAVFDGDYEKAQKFVDQAFGTIRKDEGEKAEEIKALEAEIDALYKEQDETEDYDRICALDNIIASKEYRLRKLTA